MQALINSLCRLHERRKAAADKRYKLIAECLRLEVIMLHNIPYTSEEFENAMQYLDRCDNDLLEAMIHDYNKQIEYQAEAAAAPVRVEARLPDELIYILNTTKISLP